VLEPVVDDPVAEPDEFWEGAPPKVGLILMLVAVEELELLFIAITVSPV
jgi:hypothetical protein